MLKIVEAFSRIAWMPTAETVRLPRNVITSAASTAATSVALPEKVRRQLDFETPVRSISALLVWLVPPEVWKSKPAPIRFRQRPPAHVARVRFTTSVVATADTTAFTTPRFATPVLPGPYMVESSRRFSPDDIALSIFAPTACLYAFLDSPLFTESLAMLPYEIWAWPTISAPSSSAR